MKRILAIVLTMVCLMGMMVGCGNDEQPGGTAAKTLSRGTFEGDVYTSEFIGVSFTKPKTWVYATDEEIAATMQIGAELVNQENFLAQAEKMNNVYDMMVRDVMTGNNINVVFENLKASASSNITVEQYIEVARKQLIEQAPMLGYKFGEAEKCKLGEQEFYRLPAEGSYSGIAFNQRIYFRKEGSYMIVITLSLFDDTNGATIEALFK